MNIALCFLFLLLITLVKGLISDPVHEFVTLDTVTDQDFAPLMSRDWTQRLPEDMRRYRDQILANLHLAYHEHKRNERISHRLKIAERFL